MRWRVAGRFRAAAFLAFGVSPPGMFPPGVKDRAVSLSLSQFRRRRARLGPLRLAVSARQALFSSRFHPPCSSEFRDTHG